MLRRLLLCFALLFCPVRLLAELQVFELQHADAETLLPIVQPLLGPYESVSVYRNSLVVSADAGAMSRISELLAELDTPQRNLLISVRRNGEASTTQQGGAISGTLQQGNVSISTGRRATGSGSSVTVNGSRHISTGERGDSQSIRALEGKPVLINNGQLLPLPGGGRWGMGIDYQEIQQGFLVSARVNGDRVRLEIDERGDRIDGATVRTGTLQSTVTGRLGEWIYLGSVEQSTQHSNAGVGSRLQTGTRSSEQVEVRVELID